MLPVFHFWSCSAWKERAPSPGAGGQSDGRETLHLLRYPITYSELGFNTFSKNSSAVAGVERIKLATCQRHSSTPSALSPRAAKSLPLLPLPLLPVPLQSPLVKPARTIVVDSLSRPAASTVEAVASTASWKESSSGVPAWKVRMVFVEK